MKIQILTTADYASVDSATGKMNILGIFNRINAQQFPTTHPRMVLALKLAADSPTESGEPRSILLRLTDEDGKELFQIATVVQMPRDQFGIRQDANLTIEFNALEFPHPGTYEFAVLEDGEKIGETVINLVQMPGSVSAK